MKEKKKEVKEEKKLSQKKFEEKVKKLAKEGLTSEKIGQKLRDEGIHPKEYSGKISHILGELYKNPDLKNVEEKLNRIESHSKKNKQDKRAKREKDRVFSQLRKLKKYFGIEIK
ncbi:hypothetical protein CO037_02140 [Candidatus Pacearchaeota archaeon CG_4_9_14_0_2_um_filter_30_8]|nr:MAG: hypothetical protein CO037_02140 [Candidatus Pacearchaeota archaeon CG_4_9_14_0_2_um_filter_30_8]